VVRSAHQSCSLRAAFNAGPNYRVSGVFRGRTARKLTKPAGSRPAGFYLD
jgi:hypothetical protein